MDEPKTTYLVPPTPLWSEGKKHRAPGRHTNSPWQSRELTVDEEHTAVHEALRTAHTKLWRDLWQENERLKAEVKRLTRELSRTTKENQ